jgi:hypothetical protein
MTDLRQGVTDAGHAVLDCLDLNKSRWGDTVSQDIQLLWAGNLAVSASAAHFSLAQTREMAVEAAARLIDAIGELDRRIAAGEA